MATLDESFKKIKDILNAEPIHDEGEKVIAELTLASVDIFEVFCKNVESITGLLQELVDVQRNKP